MFKPNYYEKKTFYRSQGIFQSCMIGVKYYTWSQTSDGHHVLNFFLPRETEQIKLDKTIEYLTHAFRKVLVSYANAKMTNPATGISESLVHVSLLFRQDKRRHLNARNKRI